MGKQTIAIEANLELSEMQMRRIISLKFAGNSPKTTITHIGTMEVLDDRYDNRLEPLCDMGICQMTITSWGMQTIAYNLTTFGVYVYNELQLLELKPIK